MSDKSGDQGIHNGQAYVASLPGRHLVDPEVITSGASSYGYAAEAVVLPAVGGPGLPVNPPKAAPGTPAKPVLAATGGLGAPLLALVIIGGGFLARRQLLSR